MTIGSVLAFVLGAVVASFLNVVIYRVPRGESIVSPPSHCPKCNTRIEWFRNLPIVGYLMLGGRCAHCRTRISPRYPMVELLGAMLFLAAFWRYGYFAPLAWVWIALMIVGSFIDFDHQLLPDFVTIGGMVYGLSLAAVFDGAAHFGRWHWHNLLPGQPLFAMRMVWSAAGLAAGLAVMWFVRWAGTKAFGREAMGMGDVLLLGAMGALGGPVAVGFTLMLACVAGSVFGLVAIAAAKTRLGAYTAIPFGPWLCLAFLVWMFAGPRMVGAYLELLGCGGAI